MPSLPVLLACAVLALIYTVAILCIAKAISTPDDDEYAAMGRNERRAGPRPPAPTTPDPGLPERIERWERRRASGG